jgi:hypothetical protein
MRRMSTTAATPPEAKTPRITIETIALTATGVVAMGTVIGSATSLYHIGVHAYPAAPWALPLAVDVTAMTAGLAVRARPRDWFARIVLIGLTIFSAGLQWVETGSPIAMAVVFGAFLSFELAMRLVPETLDAPTPVEVKAETRGQRIRRQAAEQGIAGRSKMTVDQLEAALAGKRVPRKRTSSPARPQLVPVDSATA